MKLTTVQVAIKDKMIKRVNTYYWDENSGQTRQKTQTVRISPEIHRIAKKAAIDLGIGLQTYIENLIKNEVNPK